MKNLLSQRKISSNQLYLLDLFSKTVTFTKFLPKMPDRELRLFSHWNAVWKLRNFTATILSQKFREINFLLKNFTLNWLDEKNLYGSEFLVFLHTLCERTVRKLRIFSLTLFWKNFVKATILLKKLSNKWFDEIFFSVNESKFYIFPHCVMGTS